MKLLITSALLVLLFVPAALAGGNKGDSAEVKRLDRAGEVFSEIMRAPDKGIPRDVLDKASCIAIVPGLSKGGLGIGGDYGKGVVMCRKAGGGWSAPSFFTVGGGTFGLQLGFEKVDLVMLIMNHHGMESLLSDKFSIGADVSASAGPVGRTAAADTDVKLNAEILTYSRSKGLFGGVSLDGTVIKQDKDDNRKFYRRDLGAREILMDGAVPVPPEAHHLARALSLESPEKNP
jgi:lipid-binding SYLF domain-containing protein